MSNGRRVSVPMGIFYNEGISRGEKITSTKSRVKNDSAQMRISFGRANVGIEFKTEREMNNNVCQDLGEAISFAHNEVPTSPYI